MWAPAAFTFLAMEWGTPGGIAIAVIVVIATAAMGPAARASERYLQRSREPSDAARPA